MHRCRRYPISTLASALLYIYISDFIILEPFGRAFPSLGFVREIVFAWLVGIAFWFSFERTWQLARRLIERPRAAHANPA